MKRLRPTMFLLTVALLMAVSPDDAAAQVIQLPSVRVFQYSGSVLVPDRGTVSLGGVSGSASSSALRGGLALPARPNALSRTVGIGNATASATIIDLAEMDRQIRSSDLQKESAKRNQRQAERNEEGKQLVRHARAQYRRGNMAASRDAYEVAISVLSGHLKDLAIAEFRRVHVSVR